MRVVTTLMYGDRTWQIVKMCGKFCAINSEYITDGRLNRDLNGVQMHASDTLEDCIEFTKRAADVDALVLSGAPIKEVINEIMNTMM